MEPPNNLGRQRSFNKLNNVIVPQLEKQHGESGIKAADVCGWSHSFHFLRSDSVSPWKCLIPIPLLGGGWWFYVFYNPTNWTSEVSQNSDSAGEEDEQRK